MWLRQRTACLAVGIVAAEGALHSCGYCRRAYRDGNLPYNRSFEQCEHEDVRQRLRRHELQHLLGEVLARDGLAFDNDLKFRDAAASVHRKQDQDSRLINGRICAILARLDPQNDAAVCGPSVPLEQRLSAKQLALVDQLVGGASATSLAREHRVAPSALLHLLRKHDIAVPQNAISTELRATLITEHDSGSAMADPNGVTASHMNLLLCHSLSDPSRSSRRCLEMLAVQPAP